MFNTEILHKHIENYSKKRGPDSKEYDEDLQERREREDYYSNFTREKILNMTREEFGEYISKLWAMLMWGNKQYVIDKMIEDNGFDEIKKDLADLLWGNSPIEKRWDFFRKKTKGFGPAIMSELLCMTNPKKYYLWNRRAYVGLNYLEAEGLPRYNYQITGKKYIEMYPYFQKIQEELEAKGFEDADFLLVDFFIWEELQGDEILNRITKPPLEVEPIPNDESEKEFLHDEVRDKIADIGRWMGFSTNTEVKVADGSVVDAIWEATIGNMGRVIYVFEVQTKGSIDGLLINLLKSLNNPAVQGVVAVSDEKQIRKIHNHSMALEGLSKKLRTWDFQEVLEVHEALEGVNESINKLGLVPQGFY